MEYSLGKLCGKHKTSLDILKIFWHYINTFSSHKGMKMEIKNRRKLENTQIYGNLTTHSKKPCCKKKKHKGNYEIFGGE